MPIQPLIQSTIFDVADWEVDAEFAVFPQGARAKEAVFAPGNPSEQVIVGGKRYLFKRSKKSYPDQFWGEVIAYRIGCLLGVPVPPAFVAYNSNTEHCAALIEWFYVDGSELFIMGGDFLQKIRPDFDRKYGSNHNLVDNSKLMRAFAQAQTLESHWQQWWIDALLFDALIGNTDRHQDNWGLIFYASGGRPKCRLSPLFDNGTSLGHERFPDRTEQWTDEDLDKYIMRGNHHAKWALLQDESPINGHLDLLKRALDEWPNARDAARGKLNFHPDELAATVASAQSIDAPVPLVAGRMNFMIRLLSRRYSLLRSLLL